MVKVLKFIICAVVVLLLFIIYESTLCAKCDYTFFVEERLMGRLLIAIYTNDINLVRDILLLKVEFASKPMSIIERLKN